MTDSQSNSQAAVPLHLRTRGNRQRWIEDRLWLRKLCLRHRLAMNRVGRRREFLPVRPIWRAMERQRACQNQLEGVK